jgi:hypothetical protein
MPKPCGNLHEFVKKLTSSYDARVADCFDAFERERKEGLFDELNDLQMCKKKDGQDSDGLILCLSRHDGSNIAKLWHRFLMLAICPTVRGPKLAHCLMVFATTHFNVNRRVVRCGEHDFGHPWHELMHRIQMRHMQLFGCNMFPKHKNLVLTGTVPDFAAVGFGLVLCDAGRCEGGPCACQMCLLDDAFACSQTCHQVLTFARLIVCAASKRLFLLFPHQL